MIRRLLALLAAVTAPAVLAGQRVEVTLEDAIERALRVQPEIVQARGDQRTAAADRRNAFGATAFTILGSSGQAYRQGIGMYGLMASSSGLVIPLTILTGGLIGFVNGATIAAANWTSYSSAFNIDGTFSNINVYNTINYQVGTVTVADATINAYKTVNSTTLALGANNLTVASGMLGIIDNSPCAISGTGKLKTGNGQDLIFYGMNSMDVYPQVDLTSGGDKPYALTSAAVSKLRIHIWILD